MDSHEQLPRLARKHEPPLITELSRLFWASAVARVAVKKEIFDILKADSLDARQLASRIGADPLHTSRLLNACVVLGLLRKKDGRYENTEISNTWLVKGSDKYQGHLVLHATNLWPAWERLEEALTTGNPVPHEKCTHQPDDIYWQQYMQSQHERAISVQQDLLLQSVDLSGRKRLLDVGGGAGSYTIALCQRYPELKGVVLDQEVTLPVARRLIESAGLSHRVSTLAADYTTDDFGSGYDVILFSGALCQESPGVYSTLLKKAYHSMVDGGLLIIQDLMHMDSEENDPALVFHDLYLVLVYGHQGAVRNADEIVHLVTGAGFSNARKIPLEGLFSIIIAEK